MGDNECQELCSENKENKEIKEQSRTPEKSISVFFDDGKPIDSEFMLCKLMIFMPRIRDGHIDMSPTVIDALIPRKPEKNAGRI